MSTEPKQAFQGEQHAPATEQRRSQRVMIRIPVELHLKSDAKSEVFPGSSVAVNDHGALIICARVFPAGTQLTIVNQKNKQQQFGKVLRPPKLTPLGFEIPIEFDKILPGFWGIAFPPPDWKPVRE